MKKKLQIVFLLLLSIVLMVVLFNTGNRVLLESVETTEIVYDAFEEIFKTTAVVTGKAHFYYFQGYISEQNYKVGDRVFKDTIVLKYKDFDNKTNNLKVSIDGFITEVSNDRVVVVDDNYFLSCKLNSDYWSLVDEETEALFLTDDKPRLARYLGKSEYGYQIDELVYYDVYFSIEDRQGLKLNQQVNLSISLDKQTCLLVDKRALLHDEKGDYLIDSGWLNDLNHLDKYRIDIKVLKFNEQFASISGIALEGKQVCIVDTAIKELLND